MRGAIPTWCTLAVLLSAVPGIAQEFTIDKPEQVDVEYSPFVNQRFPQLVFWGDTHLHTTYSPDAGMVGNFNLGPADAYRFARGEQVQANNGMQVRLVRPLDFLVVSDHAEYQGLMPVLRGGDPKLLENQVGLFDIFVIGENPVNQGFVILLKTGRIKKPQLLRNLLQAGSLACLSFLS